MTDNMVSSTEKNLTSTAVRKGRREVIRMDWIDRSDRLDYNMCTQQLDELIECKHITSNLTCLCLMTQSD